jgi:hypothetical protein
MRAHLSLSFLLELHKINARSVILAYLNEHRYTTTDKGQHIKRISVSTTKSRCECEIHTMKPLVKIKRVPAVPHPHSKETL